MSPPKDCCPGCDADDVCWGVDKLTNDGWVPVAGQQADDWRRLDASLERDEPE